jgi:hypothetical protein
MSRANVYFIVQQKEERKITSKGEREEETMDKERRVRITRGGHKQTLINQSKEGVREI